MRDFGHMRGEDIMDKNVMEKPFPWLVEERLDGTRLLSRCSELEGGCREREEVQAVKGKGDVVTFPGFLAWHRRHCRCGKNDR